MMFSTVTIELPYPGRTGNHSVRHTATGRHYVSKEALAYRALVSQALRGRRAPPGPISVAWTFVPPDRRARDADNLLKVVKDALTLAGFWADDSNKVIQRGDWEWVEPEKGGSILLTVSSLDQGGDIHICNKRTGRSPGFSS